MYEYRLCSYYKRINNNSWLKKYRSIFLFLVLRVVFQADGGAAPQGHSGTQTDSSSAISKLFQVLWRKESIEVHARDSS